MVSETNKNTEQTLERVLPEAPSTGKEVTELKTQLERENEFLKRQNETLDALVQEKTDKLRRMQIATYKITTTKQYQLIEQEAEKVELVQVLKPQEYFYFPKIGMRLCPETKGMGPDSRLYWLTGIGEFSGKTGFKEDDARYICEFLNKHPEYMHKLKNLDKDR